MSKKKSTKSFSKDEDIASMYSSSLEDEDFTDDDVSSLSSESGQEEEIFEVQRGSDKSLYDSETDESIFSKVTQEIKFKKKIEIPPKKVVKKPKVESKDEESESSDEESYKEKVVKKKKPKVESKDEESYKEKVVKKKKPKVESKDEESYKEKVMKKKKPKVESKDEESEVEDEESEVEDEESEDEESPKVKKKIPEIYIQTSTYNIPKMTKKQHSTTEKIIEHFPHLKEGTKIDNWTLKEFISETSDWQIYSILDKKNYCIKLNYTNDMLKEINFLKTLQENDADFIPKLPEKFSGKFKVKNVLGYIVFRYEGKTLMDFIKEDRNDFALYLSIILDIFQSLKQLHEYGILYVDFNPLNFSYPDLPKAVKFINFENAQNNGEKRKNKKSVGDSEWNALSFQKGGNATINTNLESFIYLSYSLFNKGLLPWSKYSDKEYKQMIAAKEVKNSLKINLNNTISDIIEYLRNNEIDYSYIEKKLEKIIIKGEEKKVEIKEADFLEKKIGEQGAQYEFRIRIFKKVKQINLDDFNLPEILNDEGKEMFYVFSDRACMKISEFVLNKLWYGVEYTKKTEDFLEIILEQIEI